MALRPTPPQTRAEQLAAQAALQGDAFMREVDDALREDTVMIAVRRYGKQVGAGLALGLAALGGYLYWNHSVEAQSAVRAEQLTIALDAVDAGRNDVATKALDPIAAEGKGASGVVAKLVEAGLMAGQGKGKDAAVRYAAIAADGDAPQPYRDFATVRAVALTFDTMKPEEIVAKIKPLALPGGAWFGPAGELLGMAYLRQGRKDLAAPLFGAMAKDKTQSDSLRGRSRQIAGLLGFDAVDDIAQPSAPVQPSAPAQP